MRHSARIANSTADNAVVRAEAMNVVNVAKRSFAGTPSITSISVDEKLQKLKVDVIVED